MNGSRTTWRKRWLPSPPLSVVVFCFWLLMNDAVTMGHSLLALLLALVIPPFAARLDREFARIGRLRGVPKMACVLALLAATIVLLAPALLARLGTALALLRLHGRNVLTALPHPRPPSLIVLSISRT